MLAKEIDLKVKGLTDEERLSIMSEPVPSEETNKVIVKEPFERDQNIEVKKEDAKESEKPIISPVIETKEDWFEKSERELSKPEGQEDLKQFTDREKAYFHQMRRDRKARQRAEEDRDAALFREIKLKNAKEEPKIDTEEDPFKDRDPGDLLTIEDYRRLNKKEVKKEEPKQEIKAPAIDIDNPTVKNYLAMCDKEAKSQYLDYEEVIELSSEIINNNPAYQQRIAESFTTGKNPAVIMYETIKNDPEFSKLLPVAQTRVKARKAPVVDTEKEKKAQAAQEALEKNQDKVRTSAHAGGSESKESGELSVDDILRMPDKEFLKLPKKKRDQIMRLYG